jgi:hypothetical protein
VWLDYEERVSRYWPAFAQNEATLARAGREKRRLGNLRWHDLRHTFD